MNQKFLLAAKGKQVNHICNVGAEQDGACKSADNAPAEHGKGSKSGADANHNPVVTSRCEAACDIFKRANCARCAGNEQRVEDVGADQVADGDVVLAPDSSIHVIRYMLYASTKQASESGCVSP